MNSGPHRPRIKICGITNFEDATMCVNTGADALGFIFYSKSPRYIAPERAAQIITKLPSYVTPVGVFVNEQRPTLEQIIHVTGVRIAQLSGDEKPEECEGLTAKLWKVFRIGDISEVQAIGRYRIAAALLDGSRDNLYGGSGIQPNLSVACAMKRFHPLVLAGGITPGNIIETIEAVQPYAVDINSGVESSPGKKDREKVESLFAQLAAHYATNA